jgi:hypothetical protein
MHYIYVCMYESREEILSFKVCPSIAMQSASYYSVNKSAGA